MKLVLDYSKSINMSIYQHRLQMITAKLGLFLPFFCFDFGLEKSKVHQKRI